MFLLIFCLRYRESGRCESPAFVYTAPMHAVTPRVVAIAVKMAMTVWMMNFQVSFFMVLFSLLSYFSRLIT